MIKTTQNQFDTPILLLSFNRPHTTQKVFSAIKAIKPKKLYIAADGPRKTHKTDEEQCAEVRKITQNVDWDCTVKTLFRDENLGGPLAGSSAITWFFENEPEGIILEDDCVPDNSFFLFCQELLEKYRDNERVMCITGDNFQNGQKRGTASYYFSAYPHIWGWATWRRAWQYWNVDFSENLQRFISHNKIQQIVEDTNTQKYWVDIFNDIKKGRINNWDYIWIASCWFRGGLTCTPNINLVSNIGFGSEAQNTLNKANPLMDLQRKEIWFPLTHPQETVVHTEADRYVAKQVFQTHRVFKHVLMRALRRVGILSKVRRIYYAIQNIVT